MTEGRPHSVMKCASKEYFSSSLQSVDSVRDIGLPLHANVLYLNIKSDSKYTLIIV